MTTQSELQAKYDAIKKLIDLKIENPGLELRPIMTMIEQILFNRTGSTIINHEEPVAATAATTTVTGRPRRKSISYDQQYELLGKFADDWREPISEHHRMANPWHIKMNSFDKCPRCKLVGILDLSRNYYKDTDTTTVYKTYLHHNKTSHYLPLAKIKGDANWDKIMNMKVNGHSNDNTK